MLPTIIFLFLLSPPCLALNFIFNSFNATGNATNFILVNDARVDSSVVRLTNDSNQFSFGRVFYPTRLSTKRRNTLSSFSTSFVFSVLPDIDSSPGFGLAFVLSNWTSPPGALASQYFGLFTNATKLVIAPLLAVEFDTGQNPEFNDPDGNHIGIDLNSIQSVKTQPAGYYNASGDFVSVSMRNGQNVHAWIEFDGVNFEINVTVVPVGVSKPVMPSLSYRDPLIANYVSNEMFVGFSASKTTWVEAQRVLAWSFSDTGVAKEINTSTLAVFSLASKTSSLSTGVIAGIVVGCVVFVIVCVGVSCLLWRKYFKLEDQSDDEIQEWELEYWPHRFSYEELHKASNGFSKDQLLGSGGFGRVYEGTLPNNTQVAVKCVNHDSKQGLREFMAEISSMGRLQHKNLVPMRGWCRKNNELMLVYDYMPNGSLNNWIFDDDAQKLLNWAQRCQVLADVAEGLNYLHSGWDQVVIHRDIKSSNILLDSDMRGRLGDFGLAKLYGHGQMANTTRVVGTLGYLAPELATVTAPTTASDVYSFGVVVLEVVCGRRPIELSVVDETILIDWVKELYGQGRLADAFDSRIAGEYTVEVIEMLLKFGLACCHPDPTKRPTMREVVVVLLGERGGATPGEMLIELGRGGSDREGEEGNDGGEMRLLQQVNL
ncbi:hypothetical protein ACFE04_018684 [Oxalis oulophora]